MKILRFIQRELVTLFQATTRADTLPVVGTLLFASAASSALIAGRMAWALKLGYSFLIWNLFLAWMPLILALLAREECRGKGRFTRRFVGISTAWLLFFPNAPYIFTDLTHLQTRLYGHYWVDLVIILCCAMTGLVAGLVSLFLMQSLVRNVAGRAAGWMFAAAACTLSGIGIYLGRFLRFNSWDVLVQPIALARGIGGWILDCLHYPVAAALPLLFGVFLFLAYVLFYAMTWLSLAAQPVLLKQEETLHESRTSA